MESVPERNTPLLVVDDDPATLTSLRAMLMAAGMPEPALVSDGRRVIDLVESKSFQAILLDLLMPQSDGMDLLRRIKERRPAVECVIVTAVDDVSSAVQAMRFGAYDYLVKPIDPEKLIITVQRALERYSLRQGLALLERRQSFSDLKDPAAFQDMMAADEVMARVFHQAETVAPTDYNLILTGESGTGKEMLARIVHRLSARSKGPFVAVNMGAFSRSLFEDDFFGHEKGAYTGAAAERRGFFEAAQGGTLFLDEVAELEPELQGKLLRVIQERELYRLGSTRVRDVDVRIVAASNRDLYEEMKGGRFRSDLFYRLNMFHIHIPALRERRKDVLPLARHFLEKHAGRLGKKILLLEDALAERLLAYSLPGNVRELENIIASATLVETGETLRLTSALHLTSPMQPAAAETPALLSLAELEMRHIREVLDLVGGNRTQAAKILGIGLRTLQRKLKEFQKLPSTPK
ncbi:MAG: sigma-54 dependent transcriptional regulator [bacterium]